MLLDSWAAWSETGSVSTPEEGKQRSPLETAADAVARGEAATHRPAPRRSLIPGVPAGSRDADLGDYGQQLLQLEMVLALPPPQQRDVAQYGDFPWVRELPEVDQRLFADQFRAALWCSSQEHTLKWVEECG